jgi:type I restriction enzyme M protein
MRPVPFAAHRKPPNKDFILPLVFVKRLCDVYDDEINRIAEKVGNREKAFKMAKADYQQARKNARPGEKPRAMTRFFLPIQPENSGHKTSIL